MPVADAENARRSVAHPRQERAPGGPDNYRSILLRLTNAQKTNKGAPAYSRYVNRPLGRRLAAAASLAGLSPNHVTAMSAVCSAVAILLLAVVSPSLLLGVTVAVMLALGYALDAADGQLARLQGSSSRSGEFLDHAVDAVKISTLHAAVLIGFFRFFELPSPTFLLVPLAFQVVAAVWFFTMILMDQMRRSSGTAAGAAARASRLRSLAAVPTDYGVLCLAFALYGVPSAFLPVYSLLFLGSSLILAASLVSWYRELSRMPSRRPADADADAR